MKNTPEQPEPDEPGHGGTRSGAGRKAGGKSRGTIAAAELREKLLRTGESPLEVMVDGMRQARAQHAKVAAKIEAFDVEAIGNPDAAKALTELMGMATRYLSTARECAKDAAPYLHPRLEPMGRVLGIELPTIKTAADITAAHDAVMEALGRGELTIEEAAKIANILDSRQRSGQLAELEQRVAEMERQRNGNH